jgi:cation-transporting ATPase E
LARAAHNSAPQAKTAATIVLFGVSLWILVIQARPLRPWKMALVAAMAALGGLAFAIPFGRRFYDLTIPSGLITLEALVLAAAGAVVVQLTSIWSMPRRSVASSP